MSDVEAPARAAYSTSQNRKGDWMQMASGRMFWPMDPRADEVCIEDIAAALSKLCRYGGHCKYFYSVAQHSCYVSYVVPEEFAFEGLMHDATEAYCVDMPRPIKRHLAGYEQLESGIWVAVADAFGMDHELPECVKQADNDVLLAEKEQIMGPAPAPWHVPGYPADIRIHEWSPRVAEAAFLARYHELSEKRRLALH